MSHTDLVTAGEAVLTRRFQVPVRFGPPERLVEWSESVILRCPVVPGAPGAPATVILKRLGGSGVVRRREAASFRYLSRFPELDGCHPCFWGVDRATGVLVLEDLGPADAQLGELLEGDDPARAREGLLAFNRSLGRMHAATVGGAGRVRERVDRETSRHPVHGLDAALEQLPGVMASLGVSRAGFEATVSRARSCLADPGPFCVWTHGDATPANAFIREAEAVLFDFEASEFRHAMVDGSFARFRYLYSVWTRFVPWEDQVAGSLAYRRALADGVPAAGDDTAYGEGFLAASLGWMAALVAHLPSVAEADRKWGRSTYRQRIAAGLEHFERLGSETPGGAAYGPAVRVAGAALGVLRRRWPETDGVLPLYRAFRS